MVVKTSLSVLMASVIYFFTISLRGGTAVAWVYGIFLLYLFVSMIFSGKVHTYRRIFQFVFAILFTLAFIGNLYDARGSMAITQNAMLESEIPFCHLVIPLAIIPYVFTKTVIFPARIVGHYAAITSMLIIWFTATVTIGRGWCAWACFYGGLEGGFAGMAKKPRVHTHTQTKEIRAFHFAVLFFLILMSLAFMSSIFCEWFCPFKLITEFTPLTDIPSLIATFVFMSVFVIFIVILPVLTKKRTQCSLLCPFGAMQSLLDRFSMYHVVIDTQKCTGCMECVRECPFSAIDIETITSKKGHVEITCAKCGACIQTCPQKAISMEFSFTQFFTKKIGAVDGVPQIKNRFEKILMSFLDPANMFVFSGFTFGVVISSTLSINGLERIIAALSSVLKLGL